MNFNIAANDNNFAIRPFPPKKPQGFPSVVGFRFEKYEKSIIDGDITAMLEHCEAIYQILIGVYGDDESIPETIIAYIYPYSNTNLSLEVQLAMITFLFNKHPNEKYYKSLKDNAEQLNANGITIEEISQRIKNQVSNNLSRWRALSWDKNKSPFPLKKRVA